MHRPQFRSLARLASLAAVLLLAAALPAGAITLSRPHLQAAIPVTQDQSAANTPEVAPFQGWVHTVMEGSNSEKPFKNEQYINTVTGQMASIPGQTFQPGEKCDVSWTDPAAMITKQYDRATNTITLTDAPSWVSRMGRYNTPAAQWEQMKSFPHFTLASFDPATGAQAFTCTSPGPDHRKMQGTVWIDPNTHFITKMEQGTPGSKPLFSVEYHYGDRDLNDIYDLGVPHDAAVVDHSMPQEQRQFLAQLQAQLELGLGDGVALETSTSVPADPKKKHRDPVPQYMMLYAAQGDNHLSMSFNPGWKTHDWGNPKAVLPANWPTPDLNDALRFIDQLHSEQVQVTDGHTVWNTQWNGTGKTTLEHRTITPDEAKSWFRGPMGRFWPGYVGNSPQSSFTLDHRPDNPSLIGLHIIWKEFRDGKVQSNIQSEQTYWLDPARNLVPVEQDSQYYNQKGAKGGSSKTQFLEYAQLSDGRWYPTHWREVFTNPKGKVGGASESYLIFAAGKTLDASWFTDPSARFTARDYNMGPQKKTVTAAVATATVAAVHNIWWWWPWAMAVIVFTAAGVMAIKQRRAQSAAPALRGHMGPRRR